MDSNHRPPGPEPGEWPFCRLLQVFANYPYSAVFFIFSMTSRVLALHWLAAVCHLSMHEKGKKRASLAKLLIPDSLVGTAVRHLVAVIKSQGGQNAYGAVPPRSLRPARLGGQGGSSLNHRSAIRRAIKDFTHLRAYAAWSTHRRLISRAPGDHLSQPTR